MKVAWQGKGDTAAQRVAKTTQQHDVLCGKQGDATRATRAKATRDEEAGRRGSCERREHQRRKKKKRKDAPGAYSIAPRVCEQKGRSVVKRKGDNPPHGLPARGGS